MIPKYAIGDKLWSFNSKIMQFQRFEIDQIVIKKHTINYCTKDGVNFDENELFLTKNEAIDSLQAKLEGMRDIKHESKQNFKLF